MEPMTMLALASAAGGIFDSFFGESQADKNKAKEKQLTEMQSKWFSHINSGLAKRLDRIAKNNKQSLASYRENLKQRFRNSGINESSPLVNQAYTDVQLKMEDKQLNAIEALTEAADTQKFKVEMNTDQAILNLPEEQPIQWGKLLGAAGGLLMNNYLGGDSTASTTNASQSPAIPSLTFETETDNYLTELSIDDDMITSFTDDLGNIWDERH